MSEGLYVYCIIETGEARNFGPIGVGGRGDPVTTISYHDLSAVVSTVSMERYVVGRQVLLAHEQVLERVMVDHTLLPVRFYTVAPNAEEVRALLRSRRLEFKKLLRELDNKVELGVKALWKDVEHVLRDIVASGPQRDALGSPAETGQRIRARLEQRKASLTEALLEPFRPLVVGLKLGRTYGDDMIMNAAFLVDRTREKAMDAAVGGIGARYADTVMFRYVGPVPPYSFVSIVIKDDGATSTAPER
ncbi:MAG: GvpL/GvpF family gas vesicle protein [Chloroflexi bacterium]|nr:GvpL/GvpF family gas vesicle protein [Chloroflexota bacterium]